MVRYKLMRIDEIGNITLNIGYDAKSDEYVLMALQKMIYKFLKELDQLNNTTAYRDIQVSLK